MGFREITDLRKSGNLDAALKLALQEHAAAPDDQSRQRIRPQGRHPSQRRAEVRPPQV